MEKIYLRPITQEEYLKWSVHSLEGYAKEKEKSGLSPEDARQVAEQSFKRLLPDGERTQGQFLYSVVEKSSEKVVGTIWWGFQGEGQVKNPWIYDIELLPDARGKGYGRATMEAAEKVLKGQGYKKLGLHVFGHNAVARKLYESMNFQATSLIMSKILE